MTVPLVIARFRGACANSGSDGRGSEGDTVPGPLDGKKGQKYIPFLASMYQFCRVTLIPQLERLSCFNRFRSPGDAAEQKEMFHTLLSAQHVRNPILSIVCFFY